MEIVFSTLKVGDIIKTSYGTGPYEIVEVSGPFDYPSFLDQLNLGSDAPKSPPNFSYRCKMVGGKKADYFLNGYDGVTHRNVWRENDYIITQEDESLLLTILII